MGPPSNQQTHEVYVIESGLYSLVLRSKTPSAHAFQRWVTSEVLPCIRRTGSYGAPIIPPELTTAISELQQAVRDLKSSSSSGVQHTAICLSTPQASKEEKRMLKHGKVLSAQELTQLNESESVVQLSAWLDSKVKATNPEAKRKILYAFRTEAKEARLSQAELDDNKIPLTWMQGGHRIVWTQHDDELLCRVLHDLQPKFQAMMKHYAKMANPPKKKQKQVTIDRFFQKR